MNHIISVEQAKTLDGLFNERVQCSPEAEAYRYYDEDREIWCGYTWTQMYAQVALWQAALIRESLTPGDRVAVMIRNRPEWVMFDQAALGLGLVVVPFYIEDRAENVAYMLADAGVRLLMLEDSAQRPEICKACSDIESLQRIVLVESTGENNVCSSLSDDPRLLTLPKWLPAEAEDVQHISSDPYSLATIIYTSGTTGRPKGVMLSHANLVFVASQGKRTGRILPEDVSLCLMPISHSYGLTTMQGMLFAGGRQHLMARFSVSGVAQLILAQTLTVLMAVPAVYSRLINFAKTQDRRLVPNRLRYLYTGTAPLDLTLRRQSEDVLGVVMQNGYGLTETSPTISRSGFALGSDETHIGVPIPGVEVRIAAPGTGEPVAAGTPGELLVRGPNVMVGYYRRPDLTRAVIDADGFFATGDIARQAEDGALHLEGRAKELIIRPGFNVYPQEIEAELNAHPGVFASAVVGRDVENDEEIIAFVELAPGQPVTARALAEFIAPRLTPYKRPQLIVILDALPLSPNAKILKHELKARAAKLPMTAVQ